MLWDAVFRSLSVVSTLQARLMARGGKQPSWLYIQWHRKKLCDCAIREQNRAKQEEGPNKVEAQLTTGSLN
jgi:hypothetical protein